MAKFYAMGNYTAKAFEGFIKDPNFILSYLSNFMSLQPGDIITTGTPPGVGMGKKPPSYLKSGDEMQLAIDHLGNQHQKVK